MYIFPIGSQTVVVDRDEKRVGRYIELERVPAPIKVHYNVRRISVTKIDSNQETNTELVQSKKEANRLFDPKLGNLVNIYV